jgi:hypothetical protein
MRTILLLGILFISRSINPEYIGNVNEWFLYVLFVIAIFGDLITTVNKIKKLNK